MNWLAPLGNGLRAWSDYRRERVAAEKTLELAEINAGIRGGDTLLKRFSFFMAISPLLLAVIMPAQVEALFARLAVLPAWYVELIMMMFASIWGLSVAKEVLPSFFERLVRAWRGKK